MKKYLSTILVILVIGSMFTACSVIKSDTQDSNNDALKKLGLAYSSGEYTINAYCTGYITSSATNVCLYITVPKLFLSDQTVKATSVSNVALRSVSGKSVGEYQGDFTAYIAGTVINNDGAILQIVLNNPDKCKDSKNTVVPNNTPVAGYADISFSVRENN